ncbi:hypothetical protein F4778DRAFT_775421 [Xylariomycetidae sp. FL2044]|nr:hypothetical protein F4778DRAFT_775421 [Xylariomycetidae sp. FL2044]
MQSSIVHEASPAARKAPKISPSKPMKQQAQSGQVSQIHPFTGVPQQPSTFPRPQQTQAAQSAPGSVLTQVQPSAQPAYSSNGPIFSSSSSQSPAMVSHQPNVYHQASTGTRVQSPSQPPVYTPVVSSTPFAGQPSGSVISYPSTQQSSPVFGKQGKPFNPTQATAALTDAGKGVKKWAKKMWQNPALKQTTAAMGGAIIAESLGGDGAAGAALANQIYQTSQQRPQPGQAPRPPGPIHAQTAPVQGHGVPSGIPQYTGPSVMNQSQSQAGGGPILPGAKPVGTQTPGRPSVVQNPGMIGPAVNVTMPQQLSTAQRPPQVFQGPPPMARPPLQMLQQPQGPLPPGPPPVDPNVNAGILLGNALVGAIIRADNQQQQGQVQGQPPQTQQYHQQQPQYPNSQEHAQSAHYQPTPEETQTATATSAPESHIAQGSTTSIHDSSVVVNNTNTYVDNTTYINNATHTVDNTAYVDNTSYVQDTTYLDNTNYAQDTTYNMGNTMYADNNTTTIVDVNADVNQMVYADTSAVYVENDISMVAMDETVVGTEWGTVDYSGGDWAGDW